MIDEKFLVLPRLVEEPKVIKSKVIKKPNIEMLTEEQSTIFDLITNTPINNFSQTLLTGYAGSGKTFLVTKILEEVLYKHKHINIAITAPTNKAVRVLKETSSLSEDNHRVTFVTLHSLLSLKRVITIDGKEEFKEIGFNSDIQYYKIIIVDEVSMLDNFLYYKLLGQAVSNKIMLLFIGDRGQIPPVNGGESELFTKHLDNNFNLTKIIRQGADNPIIKCAEIVRNGERLEHKNILNGQNNGVIFLKLKTEEPLLSVYFNSINFKKNPNFVKVLAYTNSAVNYYNELIRKLIYGENCGQLCVGEKMVCDKPVRNSKNQVILNNNDEFEIIYFKLKKETKKYDFNYYDVDILSNGEEYTIKILANESIDSFNEELEKLKEKAINAKAMLKREAWVKYYKLLERYAAVKYNYALTVHKSQGSTFDNSIVILCDINRMKIKEEKDRLLYTAITRAKDKLFII